ncbi:hypothetical protein [Pantoea sp. B9002]|uniref:hypothetical protein n=1 Tax=Pantoea sp. B9002 TaxID=2726979 RepID=UPI00351A55E2
MKWILISMITVSGAAIAGDQAFYTPEVRCLNDHTIPYITSDIPAQKVVDEAYVKCKPQLDAWMKLQEPLPDEMKHSMRKELYDFYIRMIEIRRRHEAKKTAEAAH